MQGNFELLVPQGNVIKQYYRDNDDPTFTWHYLREFDYPPLPGQLGPTPRSVTFVQSNFKGDGTHGNFEAIVRLASPLVTNRYPGLLVPMLADGVAIVGATGD